MGFDLFFNNIKFKILFGDEDNDEYVCSFVATMSDDFMENNVPEELTPGNRLLLFNSPNHEYWDVMIKSVVYDGETNYNLNIRGSCTFQLFSRSAQSGTYGSCIGLV